MTYTLLLSTKANEELENAFDWYYHKSKLSAQHFFDEVFSRIEVIRKYPKRYPKKSKNFREVSLKKFPFSIVYELEEYKKLVFIHAIFHQKRNPKLKFKNLISIN